jgi:hypothetical protein
MPGLSTSSGGFHSRCECAEDSGPPTAVTIQTFYGNPTCPADYLRHFLQAYSACDLLLANCNFQARGHATERAASKRGGQLHVARRMPWLTFSASMIARGRLLGHREHLQGRRQTRRAGPRRQRVASKISGKRLGEERLGVGGLKSSSSSKQTPSLSSIKRKRRIRFLLGSELVPSPETYTFKGALP